MNIILFYHTDTATIGKRFKNSITENFGDAAIESFHTIAELKRRVKTGPDFFTDQVYVVLVDSRRRLFELVLSFGSAEVKNLILILPEQSRQIMQMAMLLSPRFTTSISDEYKDLHLVLKLMLKKMGPPCELKVPANYKS